MAMSSKYAVTQGAIATHAQHLDSSRAEFVRSLHRFSESLAGLPTVWQGSSYQAFAGIQTKWAGAARELERALADIRTQVGQAGVIFETGEQEQAATLTATDRAIDWSAGSYRH